MSAIIIFQMGCSIKPVASEEPVLQRDPAAADRPSIYPDSKKTPGVVRSKSTVKNVCTPGFTSTIRSVPDSVRHEVFLSYLGHEPANPGDYEVDHLISLELGGSNDPRNLWPEPYDPKPGAREKDIVETHLKNMICAKPAQLTLAQAQLIITTNWFDCYRAIIKNQECVVPKAKPHYLVVPD